MFPDFSSFQVETKKLKYTTEEGVRFPQTAIITFQSKDGFQSIVELMGYMEADQIYEKIERGGDLNLDHCCIDNLSLSDYRRQHDIPKREFIKIRNFSARNSFFNSLAPVDLSFAEFEGEGISFEHACFARGGLYATNPVRVIISMLTSYSFFSLVFIFLIYFTSTDIVSSVGDPDKLSVFARSFYHSAITFLTIGYGDFYPSGAIRWISGIEGFIGLFLMSYFTVAFVRKILR